LFPDGNYKVQFSTGKLGVLGLITHRFVFDQKDGANWQKNDSDPIDLPTNWKLASVCLVGWELRCYKFGTKLTGPGQVADTKWHDGGISPSLRLSSGKLIIHCEGLFRDEDGGRPFNGFGDVLVTIYG
jgi:hypothetical protein